VAQTARSAESAFLPTLSEEKRAFKTVHLIRPASTHTTVIPNRVRHEGICCLLSPAGMPKKKTFPGRVSIYY